MQTSRLGQSQHRHRVVTTFRRIWRTRVCYRQNRKTFKKMGLKKDRGTDVMMEMGDVFSYLFQLAYMLNVDMDKMWTEHGRKMKYKNYNLH